MARSQETCVSELVRRLDEAVSNPRVESVCEGVKRALEAAVGSGEPLIPERMLIPTEGRYARRLLHKDREGRYSAVVMVWGPGQGTPLHDHAGQWCVECVYRGRIRVTSYDLDGPAESGRPLKFKEVGRVTAGVSEAGALIPPHEYHVIENREAVDAVTLHIYRGEMESFNAYMPVPGGYAPEKRRTYYTP